MVSNIKLVEIIKSVALEQQYTINEESNKFQVYFEQWNAVAFEIWENNSDYLQVHQWESNSEQEQGQYGRAVYSLRSTSDVIRFCSIMIASAAIRAKRKE